MKIKVSVSKCMLWKMKGRFLNVRVRFLFDCTFWKFFSLGVGFMCHRFGDRTFCFKIWLFGPRIWRKGFSAFYLRDMWCSRIIWILELIEWTLCGWRNCDVLFEWNDKFFFFVCLLLKFLGIIAWYLSVLFRVLLDPCFFDRNSNVSHSLISFSMIVCVGLKWFDFGLN